MATATAQDDVAANADTTPPGSPGREPGAAEPGAVEPGAAEDAGERASEHAPVLQKSASWLFSASGLSPLGSPHCGHVSPDHVSPHGSARGSRLPGQDSPVVAVDPDATARRSTTAMTFRGSPGRSQSPDGRGREPMYVTKWSHDHAGVGFQFNDSKNLVTYAGAALGPKACRAATPLPNTGQWYVEITPKCEPNAADGSPLGGNTFVGVCAAKFSCWDAAWWEDGRQEHEPNIFGLFDRGTLTRPSHDRQKDWLERSRYRNGFLPVFLRSANCVAVLTPCVRIHTYEALSCELCDTTETRWAHIHTDAGDTIGLLCDMDRRTLSFYRNGELMQDPAGHYQDGIFLNTGVSELWPCVVLGDRFHRAKIGFRPIWVQILQSTLPEHAFPVSPEAARLGSPNGRYLHDDDDAFVRKMMGLGNTDARKESRGKFKFGKREASPAGSQRSRSPESPSNAKLGSPGGQADVLTIEDSGTDGEKLGVFASPVGSRRTKKKRSGRTRGRQVLQVGQRIELTEQGKEYDKRCWGMLSQGGQGTVTQVNLDQDVCWVLWDNTKQTGIYHSVHFDWMLVSDPS